MSRDIADDAGEQRVTPLALHLRELIRSQGPVSVHDYMQMCLHDDEHGYYRRMPAIGAAGDFVTAPEISQCFGEIIGLWSAVVWQQMGRPGKFHLIELGAGRGSMLRDMLRAMRVVPGLLNAAEIGIVESNPTLAGMQRATLKDAPAAVRWLHGLPTQLDTPMIIIGNEFLDTFAIEQWHFADGAWRERSVGIDDAGRLAFMSGGATAAKLPWHDEGRPLPTTGDICERPAAAATFVADVLAPLAVQVPVAALFIDYGQTRSAYGDTLQAVRNHRYEHLLASPGEADLSAHVDFQALAGVARSAGLAVEAAMTQAEFLGRLGIVERASKLMAANPARALTIETGVKRLLDPTGMGSSFKAFCLRSPMLPSPPPF